MGITAGAHVRLRLQRMGALHQPFYRLVACHRRAKRDGKFIEILGTYNPLPNRLGSKEVTLKVDRIKHWICCGAEPSERVAKILGVAEILPPPPRRYLLQDALDEMSSDEAAEAAEEAAQAAEDRAYEGEDEGEADASADGEQAGLEAEAAELSLEDTPGAAAADGEGGGAGGEQPRT